MGAGARHPLRGGIAGGGDIEAFDRQRKTILSFAVPMHDEPGLMTGAVVALLDISERKRMEESLRAAKAQMDTFLGIASHELHTPLTLLRLQLEVTMRRLQRLICAEAATSGRTEPLLPVQESMTRMKQHLGRLERLVNDLLEMSRIQAGKLDLHLEPLDLVPLVVHAVEEQRELSLRTVVLHLPADQSVPLIADPHRIEQVLTNYLTNALKYSADEQPVEVGLEVEQGRVRVWVRDAGPGIPQSEQAIIWKRFHRVAGIEVQSGSGIGLGLGLSICREIVERHRGQVGVEGTPGDGSTFWFTVPIATEAPDDAPEGGP